LIQPTIAALRGASLPCVVHGPMRGRWSLLRNRPDALRARTPGMLLLLVRLFRFRYFVVCFM